MTGNGDDRWPAGPAGARGEDPTVPRGAAEPDDAAATERLWRPPDNERIPPPPGPWESRPSDPPRYGVAPPPASPPPYPGPPVASGPAPVAGPYPPAAPPRPAAVPPASGPPTAGPPVSGAPVSGPPPTAVPPGAAPWGAPQPGPYPPSGPAAGPPALATPVSATAPMGYRMDAPGPYPATGVPYPGSAVPYSAPAAEPPRRRRSWAGITALLLVLVLGGVAGYEGYALHQLDRKLSAANRQAAADRQTEDDRFAGIEGRTGELEKRVGSAFDPAAVAATALPSVFKIVAGPATGTAFAIGRPPSGGGTYLFTNYHVVEDVWVSGKRNVSLERRDTRFPATITKVDKEHDVALIQTTETFPRLTNATVAVKAGEPVVVVGSPLALEGSVTTGVVSAVRKIDDMAGDVIQFSAPINPGNSGGPVINSQKQVVGIASAKARDAEGIGLAVLISTACESMGVC